MGGKPLYAAVGAAEARPAIFGFRDNDGPAALLTLKGTRHGLARCGFRVLPVQPLAAGRAELYPFVGAVPHEDEGPAAQAAEGAHRLSAGPLRRRGCVPMAVGVAAASGAAINLCRPVCRKVLAADGTFRQSVHALRLSSSCRR